VSDAGLDGAEPLRELEEEPGVDEEQSLAEYLMGEEGGEWVWLLAPLLAG
jgi:hypothetical protein